MNGTQHVPLRRCIACGKVSAKSDMLRVMKCSDALTHQTYLSLDLRGKGPGRGAYVCSAACLRKACKGHAFERALRTKIQADALARIENEAMQAWKCL